MKTIKYHYLGIIETFRALFQGKYLVYFIPGAVVTIIYLYFKYRAGLVQSAIDLETGFSWVDKATGLIESGIEYIFDFFYYLMDQIYIYIVITLLSPFNTFLAEKFDSDLTGNKFDGNLIRIINDLIRMVIVVCIAVILEFGGLLMYWMVSWMLPDVLDPIMYHIIGAFFFGFAFYDFHLERYQVGVLGSLGYAFENGLTMILTGSIFLLIYEIPIIGIPLSPVIAVMISNVVYLYKAKKLPRKEELTIEAEKNV